MSKPPILKVKELIKVLQKLGFTEHHCAGSHAQFKHADGRRATIPRHYGKDIPLGTLRSILRDLEISDDQLRELRKK